MTPPAKTEGGTSEASGASPGPWPSSWAPGLLQDVNRKHGEDSCGSCFKSMVWISSDMLTWTHPHPSEPCPLLEKLEKPNYFHHSLFSLGFSCSIIVSDVRHLGHRQRKAMLIFHPPPPAPGSSASARLTRLTLTPRQSCLGTKPEV